jgi:hypothetical protein
MARTIRNPAAFNSGDGLSVRTSFFNEGYGISGSFKAYAQGGSIVPASSAFNAIGAGTVGDPLRLSQFSGFTVPTIIDISNKSTGALARAYQAGSAGASIEHVFYSDKNYEINASAVGLPGNEETVSGDFGFMSNWLLGGSAANFSMKYTFSGNAPDVTIGGVGNRAANTYFALEESLGVVASISLYVNQSGVGSEFKSSIVTISIARTADLSTVLDSAVLTMDVTAIVTDSQFAE